MSARNKFVKVRLSPDEYADVRRRADAEGATLCEHIRQQLLEGHEQLDVLDELRALRGQMASRPAVPAGSDLLAMEAVLLLRELAAARDAQILGRVRAQLAAGRIAK